MIAKLVLLAFSAAAAPLSEQEGAITGGVVNASAGRAPVSGATVVLRLQHDGGLVPFRETTTDAQGRFLFRQLPVGRDRQYLPGANRNGVHYPGPRVELTAQQPQARVELPVYDCVADPSPLLIRRHDISIRPGPDALSVTESMTIDNPSARSYVGLAPRERDEPITLQLSIPPNFERTTFDKAFFGRRFSLADGKLVTGIPWPPGQKELKFTYLVPNGRSRGRWERPLDLPCPHVRVRVETATPERVSCNLPQGQSEAGREAVFDSSDQVLPAGYTICVRLGPVPVPLAVYARWLALAILAALVAGTSIVILGRRLRAKSRASQPKTSEVLKTSEVSRIGVAGAKRSVPQRPLAGASRRSAASHRGPPS